MNILIFGDSITWGKRDPEYGGWANHLRNYFEKKGEGIRVYYLGIDGDTTTDLLNRLEGEAKARKPDIIIFAIGINDIQYVHSPDELRKSGDIFKQNCTKLLATAHTFTDKIIFVGLTRVEESKTFPLPESTTHKSYTNNDISQLDDTLKKFCEDNKLTYIPMKSVLENEDLADGLHPNTQGHIKIFELMKSEIESIL